MSVGVPERDTNFVPDKLVSAYVKSFTSVISVGVFFIIYLSFHFLR